MYYSKKNLQKKISASDFKHTLELLKRAGVEGGVENKKVTAPLRDQLPILDLFPP